MAAPAVEKPAAEAPRVNKVSVTEDDVLASLEQMKKDAPQTAPKEGSMAAMAAEKKERLRKFLLAEGNLEIAEEKMKRKYKGSGHPGKASIKRMGDMAERKDRLERGFLPDDCTEIERCVDNVGGFTCTDMCGVAGGNECVLMS